MKINAILATLMLCLISNAFADSRYAAKDSTEADLTFAFRVEFTSDIVPNESTARPKIEAQVAHLFGSMALAQYAAVPLGNHEISQVTIRSLEEQRYEAAYHYQGRIVLKNGPLNKYQMALPINPEEVYDASTVKSHGQTYYPCTDAEHYGEDAFWYYWSPDRPGCPLKEGTDFERFEGTLQRLPNTRTTYPEYDRLSPGQDHTIAVHVFFGMVSSANNPYPLQSNDENAANYRRVRADLQRLGLRGRQWSQTEMQAIAGNTNLPFIEEFSGDLAKAKVVIRLFFGPSQIYEKSRAFHYFLKDALEHAAVILYNGHSGFGQNLRLPQIEAKEKFKIQLPKDRYQMIYFDSCSSYPYYRSLYFDRKVSPADPKGTKNLDILTNGLSTYFSVMGNASSVILRAIHQWAEGRGATSFQALAAQIDSQNLFGINGDEDNPTMPPTY